MTVGAFDHHRLIPRRKIAVWIAQATVEGAAALGTPLREVAHAALGTLDPHRHRLRVLALGVRRAGEEFAEPPGRDHHRRAALLADLVRRALGHLVLLDRARVVALLRRVAHARDVRSEAAALHLERA